MTAPATAAPSQILLGALAAIRQTPPAARQTSAPVETAAPTPPTDNLLAPGRRPSPLGQRLDIRV
jgi:hypothetical protein